jgi:hypothetical protein
MLLDRVRPTKYAAFHFFLYRSDGCLLTNHLCCPTVTIAFYSLTLDLNLCSRIDLPK